MVLAIREATLPCPGLVRPFDAVPRGTTTRPFEGLIHAAPTRATAVATLVPRAAPFLRADVNVVVGTGLAPPVDVPTATTVAAAARLVFTMGVRRPWVVPFRGGTATPTPP